MKDNHPLRAAGYIRVSDPSQVDGYSLDAQRSEIARWCERNGHELVHVYSEDGVTARSEHIERRPQLVALLNDAERGELDLVVVHTLDRWARNVGAQKQALQRLGDANVGFASVLENIDFTTSAGRLVLTNLGAAHEFFSDQLAEHVKKAQRQRSLLGLPVGPVPFGYVTPKPGATSVVERRAADAVRQVFIRRAAGASTGQIVIGLNAEGFTTRKGRIFTAHAVKDMLNTRFYLGVVGHNGQEFPGQHEAIIPEALFEQVQARRHRHTYTRHVNGPVACSKA